MNIILEDAVAVYVAMAVALSVWIVIFIYLWRIDAHAKEMRRQLDSKSRTEQNPVPTATLRAQKARESSE
jgi:hypothetical protein